MAISGTRITVCTAAIKLITCILNDDGFVTSKELFGTESPTLFKNRSLLSTAIPFKTSKPASNKPYSVNAISNWVFLSPVWSCEQNQNSKIIPNVPNPNIQDKPAKSHTASFFTD